MRKIVAIFRTLCAINLLTTDFIFIKLLIPNHNPIKFPYFTDMEIET